LAREFEGPIHLLVSDVIMPQMNGPELAAQLSASRPEMKVLYVSGYSDNDIGDHGVLGGHIELLQKPFTPQVLARKVRDVIEERAAAPTRA
ncbi:MAG: response regulator, partial [Verrucomicrobiota bacterium]|nr:response regulator [Verrucomicrobiota bacterium]